MALECSRCAQPIALVYFRRPEKTPQRLRWLRILLLIGAFLTLSSLISLLEVAGQLVDTTTFLRTAVFQNPQAEPELRDSVRILYNTSTLFVIVTLGLIVYLVIRYLLILRRGIRRGHPRTYEMIRGLAILQLFIQGITFASILFIFSDLETTTVKPAFGLNVLIAPAILLLCRRGDIRQYFSAYEVMEAPARPGTSMPASPAGPPTSWQVLEEPPR